MNRYALALILGVAILIAGSPSAAQPPCIFDYHIPYSVEVRPLAPCVGQEVTLVIRSCAECDHLFAGWYLGNGIVDLRFRSRQNCPYNPCTPESTTIALGSFGIGTTPITLKATAIVETGGLDSTVCTVTQNRTIYIPVGSCSPGALPFVNRVLVGPPRPCIPEDPCPPIICPYDSIPVTVIGELPNSCYAVTGVEYEPGSTPDARTLHLTIQSNVGCGPCYEGPYPLYAQINIPGLPPGDWTLDVHETIDNVCQPGAIDSSYHDQVGFTVQQQCDTLPPPTNCFHVDWQHGPNFCDSFVDPNHSGFVRMTLRSSFPISGLQGKIRFDPPGLQYINLQGIGPAQGWYVAQTGREDGVDFVMFSPDGSVIPASDLSVPILALLTVVAPPIPVPSVTYVTANELLASDPYGQQIPECPILTPVRPAARICAQGRQCDVNFDGVADVRDLVLMVNCVQGFGFCPDPTGGTYDCDGNGQKSLDDVLCCARVVLLGDISDTTRGRPEPDVGVSFGTPVANDVMLELPLRIAAADRVGGARLALRYPSDRYEVMGVDITTHRSAWLKLHETRNPDEVVVGLIRLAPTEGPLEVRLSLRLREGQTAGGSVRLEKAELSGPDGVALETGFTPATLAVGERRRVAMSAAQPNPFSRQTEFSLTLAQATDVEVTVHDLAGRRVAELHRGRIEAGTRGFRWSGVDTRGTRVRDGMYFVHVRAGDDEVTRKVALVTR